jgi:hypothetical protein
VIQLQEMQMVEIAVIQTMMAEQVDLELAERQQPVTVVQV